MEPVLFHENQNFLWLLQANKHKKQPPEVFCEKAVFRNFAKFTGKRLCQSLFFNKDAGLRPVSFVKFLITPFPTEHLWWLLLKHSFVQKATIETLEKCLKYVQS